MMDEDDSPAKGGPVAATIYATVFVYVVSRHVCDGLTIRASSHSAAAKRLSTRDREAELLHFDG